MITTTRTTSKRGDALLREALFMSANQARRYDPSLAAKYHRLMVDAGKHHNSALCHIATTLLTRIAACWNNKTPYLLRDVDGRIVSGAEARAIIAERYQIPDDIAEPAAPRRGEPAKQGVTTCSINRPVPRQR